MSNKGSASRYNVAKMIVKILNFKIPVKPVKMSFFNLDAKRTVNEVLVSKIDLMRPWQEALKEYLETEWKNI